MKAFSLEGWISVVWPLDHRGGLASFSLNQNVFNKYWIVRSIMILFSVFCSCWCPITAWSNWSPDEFCTGRRLGCDYCDTCRQPRINHK
jgi:hypothetical protein